MDGVVGWQRTPSEGLEAGGRPSVIRPGYSDEEGIKKDAHDENPYDRRSEGIIEGVENRARTGWDKRSDPKPDEGF